MIKKIGIILFFVGATLVVAHCLIGGTAFADSYTQDGQPCPPECVSDSMEIITYYPSPYGYYEELRGDKIIVGDSDNSYIDETNLPPSGTITFEPLSDDPDASDGNLYEGSLYYQGVVGGTNGKFRFYDGSEWKDISGNSKLAAYSTLARPVCNSASLGTMIYDSTENRPYVCIVDNGNYKFRKFVMDKSLSYSGSTKTISDCEDAGGTLYSDTSGTFCRLGLNNCPTGWTQASNWQRYSVAEWGGDSCGMHKSNGPIVFSNVSAAGKSSGQGSGGSCNGGCSGIWNSKCEQCYSCNFWMYYSPVVVTQNPSDSRVEIGCK